MYSPQVLDHFEHPRNAGLVNAPNATAQVENPVCGDVVRLTARISHGRITEIKFLAKGCVPAMACASALAEFLEGKTLTQAAALKKEELIEKLGGLPEASAHAGHLSLDAVAALLRSSPK